MIIDYERLKNFLADSNLVTAKNLELAQAEAQATGRRLDDVLLKRQLVSEEILAKSKAYILGIPFVDLTAQIVERDVLKIIPEPIARHSNIVAFKKTDNNLEVAMLDPAD